MNDITNISFSDFSQKNSHIFGIFSADVKVPDSYSCKKGAKQFSRLFYVVKGAIIFNKGTTNTIRASKNDIVYLPNDVEYESEWDNSEDGKYISINFILDEFYVKFPDSIYIVATDTHGTYLEMFQNAYSIWENGALGYKFDILSLIYKIFYHLFIDSKYDNLKENIINKGIIYLENHYIEDITVAKLAQMCNISECSFRRHFKKYKNMSPIAYRNYLRIKKAHELIKSGEYNVTEASIAVNIPDLCYFNRLFKRTYNISPGAIMRNHLE